ncbi:MAG: hypothetical protein CMH49_03330 [Myxococcales bacterium]|nr:hypothetical protein [Myxococcales bacterium]
MINCALIGYGYWGQILSQRLITQDGFRLKYICDLDYDKFLLKSLGVKDHFIFGDLRDQPILIQNSKQIFADPLIEVVFIATPPKSHYQLAYQALTNGKHVWLEKPGTTSLAEYMALQNLAIKQSCLLYVDFIVLFEPWYRYLKSRSSFDKKQTLRVLSVRETIGAQGLDQSKTESDAIELLYDLAVHDLSVLKSLFPRLDAKSIAVEYSRFSEHLALPVNQMEQMGLEAQSQSRHVLNLDSCDFQAKVLIDRKAHRKVRYCQIGSSIYYLSNQDHCWYHVDQGIEDSEHIEDLALSKQAASKVQAIPQASPQQIDSLGLALLNFYDALRGLRQVNDNVDIAKFVHQILDQCS